MKNPLNNLFNPAEQKVLLFLLSFLLLGSILQLKGYNPQSAESMAADSLAQALQTDEVFKIDIRSASERDLQALSGIGPKRAQSIVEYRSQKPFQNVNEIMQISGIGIKTYQKLLPNLLVFGDSSAVAKTKKSAADTTKARKGDKTPAKSADDSPVNINTGGIAELSKLSGIGKAKAQAIIDYRAEHGAFAKAEDLVNVKGIGAATLSKNRHRIRI